jgi:hypothetical protein
MHPKDIAKLRALTNFDQLIAYLRDELDWPIEAEDADDYTFDYEPAELGIDPKHAVKIKTIKQVRPLVDTQPWGIFYVEFESKRLPVVVLRRILRSVVSTGRRRDPNRPVWRLDDLLFISAQGDAGYRSISFAHFRQREDRVPELRTFSWDTRETHFYYIKNLNLEALRWPEDDADADAWRQQWSRAFTVAHRYTITTSQMLARQMARHAATVRDLVNDVYALETGDGPLHRLYDNFREVLLHDLTPEAFADMVAQTVAYGLFSAAAQSGDLTYDRMVELIPSTNPFLKDLLGELTTQGAVDLEELGVGQLVDLLRQTDMDAILHDFGRQTGRGREDPVVHFYELFLGSYDREQKVRRGVFYTPDPVVSYIVRSVDHLLKTEFGLPDGLADTSVDPQTGEPLVQILDPATGTGTFLAHVIDQIEHTVKAKPGADWNTYVADHLLPRLNGFELMMAPYAVAHMKLGLKLRQTGYDFSSGERLRVYLTNTLEEPVEAHETLALAGFLSKESNAAARVKRQAPITVVIGNPPYANFGRMNTGEWITSLIGDWKPVSEKKWNPDDFMKFMRWAQWRIEQTGQGILAFITNSSYIEGITHRCMRQSLMNTFTDIYILDLHGSLMKKETAPDGSEDENVFDIQQGVAIGIFVKNSKARKPTIVRFAEVWGLRERKYTQLLKTDLGIIKWQELTEVERTSCLGDFRFFAPKAFENIDEYCNGWSATDALPSYSSGIQTKRDKVAIAQTKAGLLSTLRDFATMDPDSIRSKFGLPADGRDWRIEWASEHASDIIKRPEGLSMCLYRPFDQRWTVIDDRSKGFVAYPRFDIMRHMLKSNIALILTRQLSLPTFQHVWVTRHPVDGNTISLQTREYNYLFPFYLYTTPTRTTGSLFETIEVARRPNLSREFVTIAGKKLSLRFISDGRGDLSQTFGPEDILHYAYAIFHSPTYRTRYAEFLKIDFPRLPLTSNRELFATLVSLGADLVALHLLEDDYPAASWNQNRRGDPSWSPSSWSPSSWSPSPSPLREPITTFVEGVNGATLGAFSKSKCYEDGKVYLDTSRRSSCSYFSGLPEDVWNFHVGGYQVCYKWLYDRRGKKGVPGRTLTPDDIAHYQRIIVALKHTIRLMEEIDQVIEAHGGWPIE